MAKKKVRSIPKKKTKKSVQTAVSSQADEALSFEAKQNLLVDRDLSDLELDELIVIDQSRGLIFENETKLGEYFHEPLEWLENLYQSRREESDFNDDQQVELESFLELTLDQPTEIWRLEKSGFEIPLHVFISEFKEFHYVVVTYIASDTNEPTFVLTHFPTRSEAMIEAFQLGDLIYDHHIESVQNATLEGDALSDQDPLAVGLFLSMVKVRSEKDIPESEFKKCAVLREETIENPDEIWKKNDSEGNVLVTFIKDFPDFEIPDTSYIVITQEDETSGVNALLFSFPTNDSSLVDRYRQGENLEADEVVQESSH